MKYANVVLIRGKSALMQLRDDKSNISFPGKWCLPGGAIEEGEEAKKAGIREFEEETGYRLSNPQYLKTDEYSFLKDSPQVHLFYELFDEKQVIKCLEGQKMEFKTLEELRDLSTFPGHNLYAMEAIAKVQKFPKESHLNLQ